MKYVKTFESHSKGMEAQQLLDAPSGLTPNSPEIEKATQNLAKSRGLDTDEVLDVQDEIKMIPTKTNEEEEPFTLLSAAIFVAGAAIITACGFGSAALTAKKGLKMVVQEEAEKRAKEIVEKNPEAAKDLDSLSQSIYDNLMKDKEFIKKVKSEWSKDALINKGGTKGGITFGTAGRY